MLRAALVHHLRRFLLPDNPFSQGRDLFVGHARAFKISVFKQYISLFGLVREPLPTFEEVANKLPRELSDLKSVAY